MHLPSVGAAASAASRTTNPAARLSQAHTLFLHTNVRADFGPLKWIFATPEHHHWHHANERDSRDHNFAAQLAVIDRIGGTLFMPRNRKPLGYGLKEAVPHHYHQQLIYPFQRLIDRMPLIGRGKVDVVPVPRDDQRQA